MDYKFPFVCNHVVVVYGKMKKEKGKNETEGFVCLVYKITGLFCHVCGRVSLVAVSVISLLENIPYIYINA